MDVSETTDHGLTCRCGETFDTVDKLEEHVAVHRRQPDPREGAARPPTDDELEALVQWYRDTYDMDRRDAVQTVDHCYHVMIEDYVTGCPGYAGRVLIAIGDAAPSFHGVYTWQDGDLTRRDQADEVRLRGGEE